MEDSRTLVWSNICSETIRDAIYTLSNYKCQSFSQQITSMCYIKHVLKPVRLSRLQSVREQNQMGDFIGSDATVSNFHNICNPLGAILIAGMFARRSGLQAAKGLEKRSFATHILCHQKQILIVNPTRLFAGIQACWGFRFWRVYRDATLCNVCGLEP